DLIVRNAARLCGGMYATLYRYDGKLIHFEATRDTTGAVEATVCENFPRPADHSSLIGRAILERKVVNVADIRTDPRANPLIGRRTGEKLWFRAMVQVPLLAPERAIGGIAVARAEPGGFSDQEVALLQTFADQAVI